MAIGAARNGAFVERMNVFDTGNLLNADHPLMFCLVRQHGGTSHIADGINAWHVCAAILIDHNAAAVGFHTQSLQTKILNIADHAHRRLGFSDEEVAGWCRAAGFNAITCRHLEGSELTVTIWLVEHTKGGKPVLRVVEGAGS